MRKNNNKMTRKCFEALGEAKLIQRDLLNGRKIGKSWKFIEVISMNLINFTIQYFYSGGKNLGEISLKRMNASDNT